MGYEFDGVRYEKLRDMRETRRARYVGLFEAGMNFTRTAHAGGCPYVICQVRLMRGCVVSCRGLGACAGVVSVRGGVVVVVWVPPGW